MKKQRVKLTRPDGTSHAAWLWTAETPEDAAEIRRKLEAGEIQPMLPDTLPLALAKRARDRRREIAARQRKAEP